MPDPGTPIPRGQRGENGQSGRDPRADYLKAAAIVGVVCIHAGLPFHDVFRFGVPVFIGLWAYFMEQALARRPPPAHAAYLGRRLVELGVAYLVWTLLYVGTFYQGRWESTPLHTIVGGWFGGYGWAGQYYFVILFQLTLLYPLLRRWIAGPAILPLIALGVALNVVAGYWLFEARWIGAIHDRLFIYWIPYVAMGIALARGEFARRPGLGLVAALILLAAPFEKALLPGHSDYLLLTVTVASLLLLLATVPTGSAPHHSSRHPLARTATVLGRNTFPIFLANVAMIEICRSTGLTAAVTAVAGEWGRLAVVAVTLAASLALGWLLQTLRLGVLVGRP